MDNLDTLAPLNLLKAIRNKFFIFVSHLRLSKYPPFVYYKPRGYKVTGADSRKISQELREGDIILRGYTDYVDGLFIRLLSGKPWTHIGYVTSKDRVIHAVAKGVSFEDIYQFCRTDKILVLRPEGLSPQEIEEISARAESMIGTPYDMDFDFDDTTAVVCSEFIFVINGPEVNRKLGVVKRRTGPPLMERDAVSPGDFPSFPGYKSVYEI